MPSTLAGTDQHAQDVAAIVVSANEAHSLESCLHTVLERGAEARLDVVVVDNESTDNSGELVETR
jgi:glycosyltransferase involved in cell wall biosynthesis